MNRLLINILTDLLAALALTAMVATGIVIWFILPPGTNRTHWLWGLLRHDWGTIHAAASAVLLVAVTLHIALHWRWLVTNLCKRAGLGGWASRHERLAGAAVVALLVVPLGAFTLAAAFSARELQQPRHAAVGSPMPTPGSEWSSAVKQAAASILTVRCAGCHGESRPAGGVRASTLEQLTAPQRGIRWLTTGDPDASRLFEVVGLGGPASPIAPVHQLELGELATLREWIRSLPAESDQTE